LRQETAENLRHVPDGLKSDPDFSLVKQASNGDRSAFRVLFDRYVSRIYTLCLRISSDKDIADEITQIVFIKAWEKINTFKYASKFPTWLHSIAVNEYLTYKRSGKTFAGKIAELFRNNERQFRYSGGFDSTIDLESAISKLPEQARMVVILHDVEGYIHDEIAVILGIPAGTSKAALHRARKQLRKELTK
jgi:RNA polymerase sigma-70 factor (ECF subfamily)